jgi:hypothetical protein
MAVQTISPGGSVSVSGSIRYELQTFVGGAVATLTLSSQGRVHEIARAADSQSRIGSVHVPAGSSIALAGTGSSARTFDGADYRNFPASCGIGHGG